jgi:transposase
MTLGEMMSSSKLAAVGVDVSGASIDVAVQVGNKERQGRFGNTKAGFGKFVRWLAQVGVAPLKCHVCMEATGNWEVDLAEFLDDEGIVVSIVNPFAIKRFGDSYLTRNKTDKADARLIRRFCEERCPKPWARPSGRDVRLQELAQRRRQLQKDIHANSCRSNAPRVPAASIESIERILAVLREELAKTEAAISAHVAKAYSEEFELLVSIPGIGKGIAWLFLTVVAPFDRFTSAREVAAFLGATPNNYTSGTTVYRRPRMSKMGNGELRAAMFRPAQTAKRFNPTVREHVARMADRGSSKASQTGAAIRKLIHIMYGVLKNKLPFDPNHSSRQSLAGLVNGAVHMIAS